MNRSGRIGTAAETAVVRAMQTRGFPSAERRRLRGRDDAGDLTGIPGVCVEVKGGAAAKDASDAQIEAWLVETEVERVNGRADIGVLVVQRRGVGPANADRWWAVVDGRHLAPDLQMPLRMLFGDFLRWLRIQGYGDELEDSA